MLFINLADDIRHDWDLDSLQVIYDLPVTELFFRAQNLHRKFHDPTRIQKCSLLSIKTGACPEDCSYCPQSAHHNTDLEPEKLLDVEAK